MDEELLKLKQRRLLELQRQMLKKQSEEKEKQEEELVKEPTNQDYLNRVFIGRAWEIFRTAYAQYPQLLPQIEIQLVESIKTGKINEKINGAELFQFFRQIGIPVRLKTKIRYAEKGELKTLEEKIKTDLS
jgi:DNA-binding TFAR19-related protein (PDSD5 family)